MKQPRLDTASPTRSASRQTLRSEDGIIEFRLARVSRGVFVERLKRRPGKGRILQAIMFDNDASFHRWCDADAMRHTYPLVYVALRRSGNELLIQLA